MSLSCTLLRVLPRNLLSRYVGRCASIKFPVRLQQLLLKQFVAAYRVNTDEAAKPLVEYRSLQEFFTRDLKPGVRPIRSQVVSPCDGRITQAGAISDGKLLQVKGIDYPLTEFVSDPEIASRFRGGSFVTIYLSPPDYHHVHSPVAGWVKKAVYIRGTLWPVNEWSVRNIPQLFCQNERVAVLLEGDFGAVGVVPVGATNVGSISVTFDSVRTNVGSGPRVSVKQYDVPIEKGERLSTFHLGSTVVLLFEPGRFRQSAQLGPIRMGETIGEFL